MGGNSSNAPEPASTSLFDRLISTVRHEAPAPAANAVEDPYIPHAEITVDDSGSNDSGNEVDDDGAADSDVRIHESPHEATTHHASESQKEELEDGLHGELAKEAAAIEEMVELTLDVGGDDQDEGEAPDNEPSVANDNDNGNESETVVEHHLSRPSRMKSTTSTSITPRRFRTRSREQELRCSLCSQVKGLLVFHLNATPRLSA